jgi:hypothetical protein
VHCFFWLAANECDGGKTIKNMFNLLTPPPPPPLSQVLKMNTIRSLNLSNNEIGMEAAKAFARSVF